MTRFKGQLSKRLAASGGVGEAQSHYRAISGKPP